MVEHVAPVDCWSALQGEPGARLVDVRTPDEWAAVGVPDLSTLGREAALVSWQPQFGAPPDPDFVGALGRAGVEAGRPLYFICRSGVRSLAAAQVAQAAGYGPVFNVADGFEGPPDAVGRRGTVAGWVADGLPWRRG